MSRTYFFLTFTYFLLFPVFSFGQQTSIPSQIPELEEQVSFIVTPDSPKTGDQIKIKAEAFGTDLTRAFITWKINGVTKKTGRGEQVFEFTNGTLGTTQNVFVSIVPFGGGKNIEKTFSFTPQEVDVIWESRSYTPPFYKGKALPGYLGNIIAVAIPHFVNKNSVITNPLNPTYKWKQDYSIVNDQSGFLKNTFSLKGGYLLKPETIQVEVKDDFLNKAKGEAFINFFAPEVLLYENNPLYGILHNKALTEISLKNKELSLAASPFFFETTSKKKGSLNYTWNINGTPSPIFNTDTTLFRYDTNTEGKSLVNVLIKHPTNLLQEARNQVTINLSTEN